MPSNGKDGGNISYTHECICTYSFSYLCKTFSSLPFPLSDSTPLSPLCPQPSLSSALLQTHLYFISVLFTYSHCYHSLFLLSSLICVCLMPCQSEKHHQHTERVQERQDGDKTRQIQGDTEDT